MFEELLGETNHQVVMIQTPAIEITQEWKWYQAFCKEAHVLVLERGIVIGALPICPVSTMTARKTQLLFTYLTLPLHEKSS